jgi:copper chaperone
MNRVHYHVSGLNNMEIKTQLKNVLKEVEGVTMVNVDVGRGSVEVGFGVPADEYEIMRRIEHVGCRIEG